MVPVALVEMRVKPETAAMAEVVEQAGVGYRARPRWFRAARAVRAQLAAMVARAVWAVPGAPCRETVATAVRVVPRVTAVQVAGALGAQPGTLADLVATAVRVESVAPEAMLVHRRELAPRAPMATVVLPATVGLAERVVMPGRTSAVTASLVVPAETVAPQV